MGLAINGKVYGTSGVTYIGDKPIDCGYINVDGSPKLKYFKQSLASVFNLLIPGTYLTDYRKLIDYNEPHIFMEGCFPADEHVPALIHVPSNNLVEMVSNNGSSRIKDLFAYFCFIIKYGKTDYSKDPDKKKKMTDILGSIYLTLSLGNASNIVQPPEDELDNFTFKSGSNTPLAVDEFYFSANDNNHSYITLSSVDEIYYKGKQVEFYQYAGTDVTNLANRIVIYLAGGYGVSLTPAANSIGRYVFMGLANSDIPKIIAVYKCSNYECYYTFGSESPDPVLPVGSNDHGYNIPTYTELSANKNDYTVGKLYFKGSVSADKLPDKDFDDFDDYMVYTDVPYNPYIFSNLDIDNKYTWFADSYNSMITLGADCNLDYVGTSVKTGQRAYAYRLNSYLPQGKYLVNPKSLDDSSQNFPCPTSSALVVESKSIDNEILEQRVYTDYRLDNYNIYYRRGFVGSYDFGSTHSKWFMT